MQNDQEKRDESAEAIKDIAIKIIAGQAFSLVAELLQSYGGTPKDMPKDMATVIDVMKVWNDKLQTEMARAKGEAA